MMHEKICLLHILKGFCVVIEFLMRILGLTLEFLIKNAKAHLKHLNLFKIFI